MRTTARERKWCIDEPMNLLGGEKDYSTANVARDLNHFVKLLRKIAKSGAGAHRMENNVPLWKVIEKALREPKEKK